MMSSNNEPLSFHRNDGMHDAPLLNNGYNRPFSGEDGSFKGSQDSSAPNNSVSGNSSRLPELGLNMSRFDNDLKGIVDNNKNAQPVIPKKTSNKNLPLYSNDLSDHGTLFQLSGSGRVIFPPPDSKVAKSPRSLHPAGNNNSKGKLLKPLPPLKEAPVKDPYDDLYFNPPVTEYIVESEKYRPKVETEPETHENKDLPNDISKNIYNGDDYFDPYVNRNETEYVEGTNVPEFYGSGLPPGFIPAGHTSYKELLEFVNKCFPRSEMPVPFEFKREDNAFRELCEYVQRTYPGKVRSLVGSLRQYNNHAYNDLLRYCERAVVRKPLIYESAPHHEQPFIDLNNFAIDNTKGEEMVFDTVQHDYEAFVNLRNYSISSTSAEANRFDPVSHEEQPFIDLRNFSIRNTEERVYNYTPVERENKAYNELRKYVSRSFMEQRPEEETVSRGIPPEVMSLSHENKAYSELVEYAHRKYPKTEEVYDPVPHEEQPFVDLRKFSNRNTEERIYEYIPVERENRAYSELVEYAHRKYPKTEEVYDPIPHEEQPFIDLRKFSNRNTEERVYEYIPVERENRAYNDLRKYVHRAFVDPQKDEVVDKGPALIIPIPHENLAYKQLVDYVNRELDARDELFAPVPEDLQPHTKPHSVTTEDIRDKDPSFIPVQHCIKPFNDLRDFAFVSTMEDALDFESIEYNHVPFIVLRKWAFNETINREPIFPTALHNARPFVDLNNFALTSTPKKDSSSEAIHTDEPVDINDELSEESHRSQTKPVNIWTPIKMNCSPYVELSEFAARNTGVTEPVRVPTRYSNIAYENLMRYVEKSCSRSNAKVTPVKPGTLNNLTMHTNIPSQDTGELMKDKMFDTVEIAHIDPDPIDMESDHEHSKKKGRSPTKKDSKGLGDDNELTKTHADERTDPNQVDARPTYDYVSFAIENYSRPVPDKPIRLNDKIQRKEMEFTDSEGDYLDVSDVDSKSQPHKDADLPYNSLSPKLDSNLTPDDDLSDDESIGELPRITEDPYSEDDGPRVDEHRYPNPADEELDRISKPKRSKIPKRKEMPLSNVSEPHRHYEEPRKQKDPNDEPKPLYSNNKLIEIPVIENSEVEPELAKVGKQVQKKLDNLVKSARSIFPKTKTAEELLNKLTESGNAAREYEDIEKQFNKAEKDNRELRSLSNRYDDGERRYDNRDVIRLCKKLADAKKRIEKLNNSLDYRAKLNEEKAIEFDEGVQSLRVKNQLGLQKVRKDNQECEHDIDELRGKIMDLDKRIALMKQKYSYYKSDASPNRGSLQPDGAKSREQE